MNNTAVYVQEKQKKYSFFYQTGILICRSAEMLFNSPGRLALILLLPLLSGGIITFVVGDGMFKDPADTQTGFFSISCALVFTGVFNAIGEVCRERSILKREYAACLRLDSYMASKLTVQAVICALQAMMIMSIFALKVGLDDGGIYFPPFAEYYMTAFLLILASDATGLFVSSCVRSPDAANTIAPVFLVMQIVFSGMLVVPKGVVMKSAARFMVSYWSLMAFCSINDTAKVYRESGAVQERAKMMADTYKPDLLHIVLPWTVLFMIAMIMTMLSAAVLHKIASDDR